MEHSQIVENMSLIQPLIHFSLLVDYMYKKQNLCFWLQHKIFMDEFIDPDVMIKSHLSEQQNQTLYKTGHQVLLCKRCLWQSVTHEKRWKPGSLSDRHCRSLVCVNILLFIYSVTWLLWSAAYPIPPLLMQVQAQVLHLSLALLHCAANIKNLGNSKVVNII